jgi:hypothetical protein
MITTPTRGTPGLDRGRWSLWRRYAIFIAVSNLAWEIAQLPLYTIWDALPLRDSLWAAMHCASVDWVIAMAAFCAGVIIAGDPHWPSRSFARTTAVITLLGLMYTVFSEWRNVEIVQRWAYASAMPTIGPLDTGVSPLLQWLTLPPLALLWAKRRQRLKQDEKTYS